MHYLLSTFKFIAFAFVFTLVGCSSTPIERVITKTEVAVIKTPESLLVPCEATQPPEKQKYLKSTMQEKEGLLTDLSNSLYRDLQICSSRIKSIKDFQEKEVKSIEKNRN